MTPTDGEAGHAFISYVREDAQRVGQISRVLNAAGIPVWTDKLTLQPGEDWRLQIRRAIDSNALAFVAVFSTNSEKKASSYQNEELLLAVDVLRKHPPGRVWLIPVRLDDCKLPPFDLGGGRTLDSLQRVDLFGDNSDTEAIRLVTSIMRILGSEQLTSATTAAAVLSANDESRGVELARAIKSMLPDPQRHIELDDLVMGEVAAERKALLDLQQFPTDSDRLTNSVVGTRFIVSQYDAYWRAISPLCAALSTGCAWGLPRQAELWTRAIQTIGATGPAEQSGKVALLELRNYPTIALMYAGALGAISRKNWSALKAISADPQIRLRGQRMPLIGQAHTGILLQAFPKAASLLAIGDDGRNLEDGEVEKLLNGQIGGRYTPISDHLHSRLRPLFADSIVDDDDYSDAFDEMEILLAVIADDVATQSRDQDIYLHGAWFGRFTWRGRFGEPTDQRLLRELTAQGESWGPVAAGLFGGSKDRAIMAFERFTEDAAKVRNHRW